MNENDDLSSITARLVILVLNIWYACNQINEILVYFLLRATLHEEQAVSNSTVAY